MNQMYSTQKSSKNNLTLFASIYLMVFITNALVNKFSSASDNGVALLNVLTSVIQAPLMLIILVNLAEKDMMVNLIKGCLVFLLSFSALSIALRGMGEHNLFMIMFVGSIPVFIFASMLFIDYAKQSIYQKQGSNKTIMIGGIVFAFGSYIILLLLNRINPQAHVGDFRIVLGLITVIAGLVMAFGLAFTKEDVKEDSTTTLRTPAQVGFEQWENFSLASTPDVIKKGVTDISKYYSGLQKTS